MREGLQGAGRIPGLVAIILTLLFVLAPVPAQAAMQVTMSNGNLVITGSNADEDPDITCNAGNLEVQGTGGYGLCVNLSGIWADLGGGADYIGLQEIDAAGGFTNLDDIQVDLGSGNDSFHGGDVASIVHGGAGNDELEGGPANDELFGEDGRDKLTPFEGSDRVSGGPGTDDLRDYDGSNVLVLSPSSLQTTTGTDVLSGIEVAQLTAGGGGSIVNTTAFSGRVEVSGGSGNDDIDTGPGNDSVTGEDGSDDISTGPGNDVVVENGGVGDDTVDTGKGNDDVGYYSGADSINTGSGVDRFNASTGDSATYTLTDTTFSGGTKNASFQGVETAYLWHQNSFNVTYDASAFTGDVTLTSVWGSDTLIGGSGNDTFWPSRGTNAVTGNGGIDTIGMNEDGALDAAGFTGAGFGSSFTGIERARLEGGDVDASSFPGPIAYIGSSLADIFTGGSGNDNIKGLGGSDTLAGGPGADSINGGKGTDACNGGPGEDSIKACE